MAAALILCGGWEGHEPRAFAQWYRSALEQAGYDVVVSETLDVLDEASAIQRFDLVVPVWTMGELTKRQEAVLVGAVRAGVGLAGQHGGMGDAFRSSTSYLWVVGGQFVWHPPEPVRYRVKLGPSRHPITEGIADFEVVSEQYYLHVDPSVEVLATTTFAATDGVAAGIEMPVLWTRRFGRGRVFYCSVGHATAELELPELAEVVRRGLLWATRGPARRDGA